MPAGCAWFFPALQLATFMINKKRFFQLHHPLHENLFVEEVWCKDCDLLDFGIYGPQVYNVLGKNFIPGICRNCGAKIVSEVTHKPQNK